jgi:starch-binding outer membrane protein, SusD/RagB family
MKNKIKLLSFLFLSLAFFACDDEINDLQPFTEGNPATFFNSEAAFQNGVDGIYAQFQNYYASSGSGMQGIPDILSDNVILATTGRRSNEVYFDWDYVPTTGGAIPLYWSEAYEAVNAANLVIGQIDNLADGAAKDNILGQALAARAFAHFDLVRTFAQIPTSNSGAGSSLGVVYMKVEDGDTDDPFAQFPRETVDSNYAEIIGDLERAAGLIATSNGEGRLDRDAVYGILSRVYLYNGDYQKVIDAANEVSEDIATMTELPGVYTDSNNAGVLVEWSVNTSSESRESNLGVLYSQSSLSDGEISNTISEYVIDFGFLQMIDQDDVRLDVLVFNGENQGNDYNAVKKFLGEEGQVNGLLDAKVLRVAEVLLNKAEAQFRLGDEEGALETLNVVRDNRYSSFEGEESGDDLLEAILFNRRVELAFEGHRFFDLKRLNMAITRTNTGDLSDGSGTAPDKLTLEAGNFRFLFPIPQAEINANDNMDQNPGY